uniref:uncharacterized protein LOC101242749 n=1 Tax=Ciona intestinalis TaxID=7719 RepID=UPI000EF559EB|nr:uncharacterized protein LOC101242749 [Ciona intestinalis]|eukprot:XP_026690409.1 uncharacterized protein LOC101242749 [Ciona intestinalis]
MRRKFLHTICCILGCIEIYEACHVAEHNTRKRRQIISSSDSQIEITRDVRAYFSRCLRDKVGDVWDWNSVVDVSILDTQWYENSDQSNCSRAADRDTAPCWKARVNVYLRNSSNLIPPIEECIDMFTTDTSNGRRFYLFPATSSNSIAENGICSNVNPSQAQYFPNSATIRQYTSCNTQRTTTPRGRIPLHYPSVFQFFEAHTTCGVEFVHCSNQQTETLSLGDPTVSRWPYRMEALLKPDTSTLDSVVSCNQIVFPLADTAAAWTSWTDCGVTCGGGTSTRSRECPSTVTDCISEETRNCNTKPCPGCSLSTASRSRCGAIGIGKSACVALGCCFDRNSCYRAASTTNIFDGTFQPTVRPNQNVGGETGSPGSNFNLICDSRFSALPCTKNIVTNGGVCQMLACCWEPSLRVCYRARFQIIRIRDDCPAGSTNPPTCRGMGKC